MKEISLCLLQTGGANRVPDPISMLTYYTPTDINRLQEHVPILYLLYFLLSVRPWNPGTLLTLIHRVSCLDGELCHGCCGCTVRVNAGGSPALPRNGALFSTLTPSKIALLILNFSEFSGATDFVVFLLQIVTLLTNRVRLFCILTMRRGK